MKIGDRAATCGNVREHAATCGNVREHAATCAHVDHKPRSLARHSTMMVPARQLCLRSSPISRSRPRSKRYRYDGRPPFAQATNRRDMAYPTRVDTQTMRTGRRAGSTIQYISRSAAEIVTNRESDTELASKARSDEMCELTNQKFNNPPDTVIIAHLRHCDNAL